MKIRVHVYSFDLDIDKSKIDNLDDADEIDMIIDDEIRDCLFMGGAELDFWYDIL